MKRLRFRLARPGPSWALLGSFVIATFALAGCASSATGGTRPTTTSPKPSRVESPATGLKMISFEGVQLHIPEAWPVIDGAHAQYSCSSRFAGQIDRAFLGVSYQGAPSCPAPGPRPSPAANGVWMLPGGPTPPAGTPTVLPSGETVYLSTDPRAAAVTVWYHRVQIQIGVGPNPAEQRSILNSIAFNPSMTDTAVLGRCPAPGPSPPIMPTPTRVSATLTRDNGTVTMQPEPSAVQPRVSAASVWAGLIHDFGAGAFSGPLQWSIVFGSYSAQTPATINPDGSVTPNYQHVPTWLILGNGIKTPYGSCGITVLAPYNANTGHGMGLETSG